MFSLAFDLSAMEALAFGIQTHLAVSASPAGAACPKRVLQPGLQALLCSEVEAAGRVPGLAARGMLS